MLPSLTFALGRAGYDVLRASTAVCSYGDVRLMVTEPARGAAHLRPLVAARRGGSRGLGLVGTGMGDSTIGYSLAARGFKVLFLERGTPVVARPVPLAFAATASAAAACDSNSRSRGGTPGLGAGWRADD
jgi:hypothetical protein